MHTDLLHLQDCQLELELELELALNTHACLCLQPEEGKKRKVCLCVARWREGGSECGGGTRSLHFLVFSPSFPSFSAS